ncbi:MAG: ABC transporter permease [Herpetosiphon sp.]
MRSTVPAKTATTWPSADLPLDRSIRGRALRGVRLWLPIGIGIGGVSVWQAVALSSVVPAYVLPNPGAVARKWSTLARSGILWHHVAATLTEALLGFIVAFLVGVSLGYLLGKSRVLSSVVAPYIAAVQSLPIIAIAPLLVVWFGLGLLPKVIICVLIVFFPMVVNTVVALQTIEPDLIDAAQVLGAGRWQMLRYVEIPLSLRTLLGGIKLGLSLAMTGALVSEFVAADAGLGYLMTLARSNYDSPMLYAASLTMAAVTFVGYALVTMLEHLIIDW